MQRIIRLLTPDRWQKTSVIVFVSFWVMVAVDGLFHFLYLGEQHWPVPLIVLNVALVGGPFLVLFFLVSQHQVKALRNLSLRSRKDGLTQLNNRQTFIEMAARRLQDQPNGMLLVMDADHFKAVNDTHGHAVGDICLKAIANHIRWNLRADDVAGRIGGEEFAIFLASTTIEQARAICARMTKPIPFHNCEGAGHLCITLSIGGAMSAPGLSLDRLLIRADEALYMAKDAGRARTVIWSRDRAITAAVA